MGAETISLEIVSALIGARIFPVSVKKITFLGAKGRAQNKKEEDAVRMAAARYLKSLANRIQGGRKFVCFRLSVLEGKKSIAIQCKDFPAPGS